MDGRRGTVSVSAVVVVVVVAVLVEREESAVPVRAEEGWLRESEEVEDAVVLVNDAALVLLLSLLRGHDGGKRAVAWLLMARILCAHARSERGGEAVAVLLGKVLTVSLTSKPPPLLIRPFFRGTKLVCNKVSKTKNKNKNKKQC